MPKERREMSAVNDLIGVVNTSRLTVIGVIKNVVPVVPFLSLALSGRLLNRLSRAPCASLSARVSPALVL